MAIKRKILSFTDFKKGKNSLENPVKHPIKEGVIQEIVGYSVGVLDDLKSNFRSWESDHDNEDDANGLFQILMTRHHKEDEGALRAAAFDWVGYEEDLEENSNGSPGVFPKEFWDRRADMKKGDKIQFVSQEHIVDRGAGEGLGKILADKKGTIVNVGDDKETVDIEVDGKIYKNVIDVVFDIIDENNTMHIKPVSRDEMIVKLNKRFPNIWTKKSEDFYNDPTKNTGIWTGAEGSTFIDDEKRIPAIDINTGGDKNYVDEVHKTLANFLSMNGWYTESYDAGTFFFYPIHNTPVVKESGKEGDNYIIMNDTDGITASMDTFTKSESDKFIEDFPKRYKFQGHYRTSRGENIDPNDVILRAVPVPYEDEEDIDDTNENKTNESMKIKRFEDFSAKTNESEMNELLAKDMESGEPEKDKVYKMFDKEKNGVLVHSAARFDVLDPSKGYKFTLINKPTDMVVFIKPEELKKMILTPSNFKKK